MLQLPPPQHDPADSTTVRRFFSSETGWSVGAGSCEEVMTTMLPAGPEAEPPSEQHSPGLTRRAVLRRRAREGEVADGVAADRACLPRAAVHAHGCDLRRLEPVDRD